MIYINPGSGAVKPGSREQSRINIKQFIVDITKDSNLKFRFRFKGIDEDGRHTYKVWNEIVSFEIDMPALDLEHVRYINTTTQNIWHFPRLYVNGASWVWMYAVSICLDELNEKIKPSEN